jgi:hypothetical protein
VQGSRVRSNGHTAGLGPHSGPYKGRFAASGLGVRFAFGPHSGPYPELGPRVVTDHDHGVNIARGARPSLEPRGYASHNHKRRLGSRKPGHEVMQGRNERGEFITWRHALPA